jgi:nickel/cobalt transporter (NicO) family protein
LWWLAQTQQALQAALAGHFQALRGGDPAAFRSLLGLCAASGFLHAPGPGHGKALVAGGTPGTRATALR